MRGRLESGAALAAFLYVVLSLGSVPLSAAVAQSVRGGDRAEIPTAAEQTHGGSQGAGSEAETLQARRRKSASLRRSTTGLLNKRFRTGSKLLLTVSAVAGALLMLQRLAGFLRECLGEAGAHSASRGGSTPRSLSDSPRGELCKQLLEEVSGDAGQGTAAEGSHLLRSLGGPGGVSNQVLLVVVLFAVLAMALGTPFQRAGEEPGLGFSGDDDEHFLYRYGSTVDGLEQGWLDASSASTEYDDLDFFSGDGGDYSELGSILLGNGPDITPEDETRPPVEIGEPVTIGLGWTDESGKDKEGSTEPISLHYEDRNFKLYLSSYTETALKGRGLLEKLKSSLSNPPVMDGEKLVWGAQGKGSVLCIVDDVNGVPYEVYAPAGAFGIEEDGYLPQDNKRQGLFDLWQEAYALLYVARTGKQPYADATTATRTAHTVAED